MTTAFVLGGGGLLGAHEVGMLRALAEADIRPDLVVGTSIGALNGAFVAADPDEAAARLSRMWQGDELRLAFSEKLWGRAVRLVRSGTHLHSLEPLGRMLADALPGERLRGPDAAVPVRGGQHRDGQRPLVQPAGRWCPRSWPPARCPGCCRRSRSTASTTSTAAWSTRSRSGRAVALGASTVYVLQVGRIESPLEVPTRPWQVGLVAFEIARRHRFHEEMSSLPDGRPSARPAHRRRRGSRPAWSQFRYRDRTRVGQSIERAYTASARYLSAVTPAVTWAEIRGGQPMLPPRLVRRLVLAPLVIVLALGIIVVSPLLFVLALLFGLAGLLRAGRMRNLRLVSFVVVWLTAEIVALVMLFGLWIVSGFGGRLHTEPYQRAGTTRSSGGSSTRCTAARNGPTGCGSRSTSPSSIGGRSAAAPAGAGRSSCSPGTPGRATRSCWSSSC